MHLSNLITDDSRTPIQKLRRPALQKIARDNGIKFDPSGPAENLVKLIEGNGIDVTKSGSFQKIIVKDESGMVKEVLDPIVKPHATLGKDINYDAIIEANAKSKETEAENSSLKKELDEVKALLAKLIGSQSEATNKVTDESLSDQYEKKFGKKPHHKMKPETIKAKIDAAV